MRSSTTVALVVSFSALIVGSDFALTGAYDVKLMDTLVFVAAYIFGFRVGAFVGILSETTWAFVSPVGPAGAITPFLVGGELLFALAGWGASKVWGPRPTAVSPYPVFFGALLAICAFLWDFETNAVSAFQFYWPALTMYKFLVTEFGPQVLPFTIAHELSDFVLGVVLAPAAILLIPKVMRSPL